MVFGPREKTQQGNSPQPDHQGKAFDSVRLHADEVEEALIDPGRIKKPSFFPAALAAMAQPFFRICISIGN
jgi:hypothetical protein